LAIAVCDHYNHVRELNESPDAGKSDYSKQNVLMLGPTGVGKTYLVRLIAQLIGVPFVKADATRFSETGYVGANVDDLIRDLVSQADGDIGLAQYGIIYLDEADKLASPPQRMGRDVSGRGVQVGLLKLMEETDVDLRAGHDMTSQLQAFMEFQKKGKVDKKNINTRHILFIVSGAFSGLEKIIKTRLAHRKIGIGAIIKTADEEHRLDLFQYAATEDFIEFGFEPEFIGRLPVRVSCQQLLADDLYRILKESEGSIVRQYRQSFWAFGIDAMFADDGLRRIAEKAYEEKTGARGLMTVAEQILREYKFELPSSNIVQFVVTAEVVNSPLPELTRILADAAYNQHLVLRERIHFFEQAFFSQHKMKIKFDDLVIEWIVDKAGREKVQPKIICSELLKSYEHGLKLISQNTGQLEFKITIEVVNNPQGTLEKWIKESYSTVPPVPG